MHAPKPRSVCTVQFLFPAAHASIWSTCKFPWPAKQANIPTTALIYCQPTARQYPLRHSYCSGVAGCSFGTRLHLKVMYWVHTESLSIYTLKYRLTGRRVIQACRLLYSTVLLLSFTCYWTEDEKGVDCRWRNWQLPSMQPPTG